MGGQGGDAAARRVIEGVPRVGFYDGGRRPPEDDMFPACVRAFLEHRREPRDFAGDPRKGDPWHDVHVYAMAMTGSSFRLLWNRERPRAGQSGILALAPDALEPFRRGLAAVGYGSDILLRRDFARELGIAQEGDHYEAEFRRRICESIDAGKPVIAIGVIGPPECCLVTGYEAGGDALVGWSFFQNDRAQNASVEILPSGVFRKRDWYPATRGLILIGEPRPLPPLRERCRRALEWGLRVMRTPRVRGVAAGQAAFTAWADSLLDDDAYRAMDAAALRERHGTHWMQAGTLAEARAWGAVFLHRVADAEPEVGEDLHQAARCFDAEHDLVWAMWEFTRAQSEEESARKMADPGIRRRIVPLIRLAREKDAEAAACIERALRRLSPKTPEPRAKERAVLEGVPRVGFDRHLSPFPGSLHALLTFRGEKVSYDYLMGVTGAAFRRAWNRDDGGNVDLMYFQPEPHRRAMDALGYDLRTAPRDNRAAMLALVRESIAQGSPAIAFGVIGPPEAGLVTGYDRGGDVLHGWSYFQGDAGSGYYAQRDWFKRMSRGCPIGALRVGDKLEHRRPERETLQVTLEWAVDLARTANRPGIPDHVCGLAAYEAWAAGIEVDADYPRDDPKVLATRVMVHGDQCVMLEERRNAAAYLRCMVAVAPEAAGLLTGAADLYDQAASCMDRVWLWGPDMGPAVQRALADHATRVGIAAGIREAGAIEERAVALLERALGAMRDAAEPRHQEAP
ncbi:MAG: hypothetical protein IT208_04590 [Chthonomonadales bacterium]|nr:hypothetical protein [Chthonomonadales bacterium]